MQAQDATVLLPTLPTEVIEEVIDQASGDPRSLKQLTLICKPLLTRARFHLFTSIVVRDVEQMLSSGEFLDSHPWVLPLVRKVTLSVKSPNDKKKPNFPILDMMPSNFLIRLPRLNVWRVKISFCPSYMKAQFALHRSSLLCYQAHGRHVQELELAGIPIQDVSHFVRFVSAFTSLHRLTCSEIRLRKEHQASLLDLEILNKLAKPLKIQCLSVCILIAYCSMYGAWD